MAGSDVARKKFRRAFLAACASLFLTFAAGEAAARVFLRRLWDTEALAAQLRQVSVKSLITLLDDPERMYGLRPDLDTEFLGSRVVTDSSGVRVGASKAPEPDGSIRVALIGDSTSFGWRVQHEDTYGEKLRRGLEVLAGAPVALRNFSVPGINASQETAMFVKSISAFRPRLLVVHHDHNDSQPTGWGYGGWMPPEYGENVLHSAVVKIVLRKLKAARDRAWAPPEEGQGETVEGYTVDGPDYEAMLESRRVLVQAAKAAGIPVLIVIFNPKVRADENFETDPAFQRLHQRLSERLRDMGYLVLDLYPEYQRMLAEAGLRDMSSLWVDSEDQHPNERGHAFIAEVLLNRIRETPELMRIFQKDG